MAFRRTLFQWAPLLALSLLAAAPVKAGVPSPGRVRPSPIGSPGVVIPPPKPSQPIPAQQAGNLTFFTRPVASQPVKTVTIPNLLRPTAQPLVVVVNPTTDLVGARVNTPTPVMPPNTPVTPATRTATRPTPVQPTVRPELVRPTLP